MGDFASPAAGPNGSLCINNSMNPSAGSVVPAGAVGITKHSTVVERLRQRIEGCRRHHVTCENRYQQAQAEQLDIERRETVSLYQRTLEQRAKKSAGGGGGGGKQPLSKQPEPDSASSAEQRNNTLIAVRTRSPHASRARLFAYLRARSCARCLLTAVETCCARRALSVVQEALFFFSSQAASECLCLQARVSL